MTAEFEAQAAELFLDLLECEGAVREERLAELRNTQPDLAARVEQLLAAERRASERFGSANSEVATAAEREADPRPENFGPYVVGELLGEGGFAKVWLAEQQHPVRRKVALKVLKTARRPEVATRFLAERQALARMDHPGIAKIFDGGSLTDGRPWFAMEWVDGAALTDSTVLASLDAQRPADRVALFQAVARAVQHAHQKGVLHRDLKPSNVLARREQGEWQAKVIDFGIAKALEEPLVEQTLQTQAGQVVGTPAYLAPEQVDGRDPDTRTDIYALGALFYELLSGRPPFDPEELSSGGWTGMLRLIRDRVPRPPSEATDPSQGGCQARSLQGDLDWIVLRCLEKDPDRRYASVGLLLEDLERYFAGRPVLAGPPELSYRLGKFARRHRTALTMASAFVVALIVTASIAVQRAYDARVEAGRFAGIADFFESVLHGLDPVVSQGLDTALLEQVLLDAERAIEQDDEMLPEVRATVQRSLGGAFRGIGLTGKAEKHWSEALQWRQQNLDSLSPEVLESMEDLGTLYFERNRLEEAEPLLYEAFQGWSEVEGPDGLHARRAHGRLAFLLREQDRSEESVRILERIVASERREEGGIRPEAITYLNGLAYAYSAAGDEDKALELYREALALQEKHRAPTHPHLLSALNNVGTQLLHAGKPEEAASYVQRAVDGKRAILKPGHPDLVPALNNLAQVHSAAEDYVAAEAAIEEGIAIAREHDGPESFRTVGMQLQHALILDRAGNDAKAMVVTEAALPHAIAGLTEEHFISVSLHAQLGQSLRKLERYEEAEPHFAQAAASASMVYPEGHPARMLFPMRWGVVLAALERDAEAREVLEQHADALFAMPGFATDQALLVEAMAAVERRAGNEEAARAWEARTADA